MTTNTNQSDEVGKGLAIAPYGRTAARVLTHRAVPSRPYGLWSDYRG
jgi:hypothetical protein